MKLDIWIRKSIEAESVAPGLWIHPYYLSPEDADLADLYEGVWTLTHDTGLKVADFRSKAEAETAAASLGALCDWKGSSISDAWRQIEANKAAIRPIIANRV